MRKFINFSNEHTKNVFSTVNYADFAKLLFDAGRNQLVGITSADANDKIREVFSQVLELPENASKKDIRRAIRRHKVDVYEITEETVEDLLVSGWPENPFFREFVDERNLSLGDKNEFYVEDDIILAVSELAGNHHDIIRQRLGYGSTYSVKTSWYGLKIYTEYELFMAGRIDWATFVNKIYEAADKFINDALYAAIIKADTAITPNAQFVKTGTLNRETLLELVEDVQTATGDEVVIMGTKTALAKLDAVGDSEWISDNMRDERYTTGRLGLWEGVRKVEIPQSFAPNDTTTKLVDNNKLFIMPVGSADNKFIKLVWEGDTLLSEVSDKDTNMDMSISTEYQFKMGIGTVINKKFGTWTIA